MVTKTTLKVKFKTTAVLAMILVSHKTIQIYMKQIEITPIYS